MHNVPVRNKGGYCIHDDLLSGETEFVSGLPNEWLMKTHSRENGNQALANGAHSLKGAACVVGAARISEICLRLEELAKGEILDGAGRLLEDLQQAGSAFTEELACYDFLQPAARKTS